MAAKIPYELLLAVLSNLPKKALFRSKLVSKDWLNMVDEPCLSSMHLSNVDSKYPDSILLVDKRKNEPGAIISTLTICDDLSSNTSLVANESIALTLVSNSCNGLICFASAHKNYDDLYILNPLTKRIMFVQRVQNRPNFMHRYGLGFDPETNAYKLVRVSYLSIHGFGVNGSVEVHTLGTDSWRKIEARPFDFFDEPPVFAGGALHWATPSCSVLNESGSVISFDMTNEVFNESPHHFEEVQLTVLKGCLSVIDLTVSKCIEIWLLDGERSKWFEKCEHICLSVPFNHGCGTEVLGMWDSDEILLKNNGMLYSYKMNTHQVRRVHSADDHVDFSDIKIVCFRGSLVSPFCL